MKTFLIVLILGLTFPILSYSQRKTFKVGIQHGYFNAGSAFQNVVPQKNTGIDISYFLSNCFFLTGHFNYGTSDYYETSLTKYPNDRLFWEQSGDVFTNSRLIMNNIGLLAGYYLPVTEWANLTGQVGYSQFIRITKQFPLRIIWDEDMPYTMSHADFAVVSAAFPVKFNIGVTPFKRLNIGLAKNIEIGYALGFYMEPDYGVFTGVYHGPQLSISF
jgi:hypothetical protein